MDKSNNSSKNHLNSFYPDEREHVELFVSCREIKRHSPNIQVKLYTEKNGQYEFDSETEVIKQNVNPNFMTSLIVDYFFSVKQILKFEVVEVSKSEVKQVVLGEIITTLGEIVGARNQTVTYELTTKPHNKVELIGKLIVRVEKVNYTSHLSNLTFRAEELKLHKGLFSKGLPEVALRLYRRISDTEYNIIYQSEKKSKTDAPRWRRVSMKTQKMCNGESDRPIKVEVIRCSGKTYSTVGECYFTLEQLTQHQNSELILDLIHPKSNKKQGVLHIEDIELVEKPHFLDYLRSGLQLNLMIGIDFTSSNGDPSSHDSLHAHHKDGSYNEYQKAIKGVCDILLNYDTDKRVLMFGFGGIPSFPNFSTKLTSQCFPLTGDPKNPWVEGIEGIMETYKKCFEYIELASPTYFEPILRQAMRIAKKNKDAGSEEYTILLILTDGKCHDMQDSINAIIESCYLPLSVIIVGVGNEDFTRMKILDGDDGLINDEGREAERDLVQFVPFLEYENNPDLLAKHVLEEIPEQVVEYMISQKIVPQGIDDKFSSRLLTNLMTMDDYEVPNETAREPIEERLIDPETPGTTKSSHARYFQSVEVDQTEAVIFKSHRRSQSSTVTLVGLGDPKHFTRALSFMKKNNNKFDPSKYSCTNNQNPPSGIGSMIFNKKGKSASITSETTDSKSTPKS